MQDAFFQEKGRVGGWVEIGYSAPGVGSSISYASNVFTYTGTADGTGAHSWTATARQKLNDCTSGMSWVLNASNGSESESGSGIYTSFGISDGGTDPECKTLTASWDNLFRSSN